MKTCPQGHPFESDRPDIACPFCVGIRRSRIAKTIVFTVATVAVLTHASVTMIGSVLVWFPAWVGVAMASLGNRYFLPWAGWAYLIGGLFLRTAGGYPLWHPILDILHWMALPSDAATVSGWLLVGWLQGFLLGLVGVSVDVIMRRLTNEPTPF